MCSAVFGFNRFLTTVLAPTVYKAGNTLMNTLNSWVYSWPWTIKDAIMNYVPIIGGFWIKNKASDQS